MNHRHAVQWDPGKADALDAPERERDMPAEQVVDLLGLTGPRDDHRLRRRNRSARGPEG
jgi:hypothetical protein